MGFFTTLRTAMTDPMKMFTAYQTLNTISAIVKKEKQGKINFADMMVLGGETLAESLPVFGVTIVDDLGVRDPSTMQGSLALTARQRVHDKLNSAYAEANTIDPDDD